MVTFKHVALLVPDLEKAEEHYRTIFDAELHGREAPQAQRTLYCIGLTVTPGEVAEMHGRLPDSTTVEVHTDDELTFIDRYGFRWQCSGPGFMTAGVARGDWLDL